MPTGGVTPAAGGGGSQAVKVLVSPVVTFASAGLLQDLSSQPIPGGVALFTIPSGAVLLDLWGETSINWNAFVYVDDPAVNVVNDGLIDGLTLMTTDAVQVGPCLRGAVSGFASNWGGLGGGKGPIARYTADGDIRCWADTNVTHPTQGSTVFKALILIPS